MRNSFMVLVFSCVLAATGVLGCGPVRRDTYENCIINADCIRDADSCRDITVGSSRRSMCTRSCSIGLDCPGSLNGSSGVCLEDLQCYSACSFSSDCPSGWSCQPSVRGDICLPN